MPAINYKDARIALEFLAEFAEVDLETAPRQRRARLAFRVHSVAGRDAPVRTSGRTWAQDVDTKRLAVYQSHARHLLDDVAHRRPLTIQGDLVLSFFGDARSGRLNIWAMGTTLDRFRYQMIRVLEDVGLEKIQFCPAPKPRSSDLCGRIFLKVTKKEYCSTRCQLRAYMRTQRG